MGAILGDRPTNAVTTEVVTTNIFSQRTQDYVVRAGNLTFRRVRQLDR